MAFEHSFQLQTRKRPIQYKQEGGAEIHQSLIITFSASLHFSENLFAITTCCLKKATGILAAQLKYIV